ncbi:MAG: hypothetical protein NTZ59_15235 [Bacteroidetes bacterium]|nr:hypothetical protein [Bacteroidota bacterium]
MLVKCTSCGAPQNASTSQECSYCGNQIELEQAKSNYEKSVLGETGNLMAMAETSIEATNFEEALSYFNRVLEKEITNSDAWLGKGIAIVNTSKIGDIKINEAIAYWKNAIKYGTNQEAMSKRVSKEIVETINSFFPTIFNHYKEFRTLDNSYKELVSRFSLLLKAIDYAGEIDSDNIAVFFAGYTLCKTASKITLDYALMDIKYSDAQGVLKEEAKKSAKLRKQEILRLANSIYTIEAGYIENVKRIDPKIEVISSEEEFKNSKEGIEKEIIETFKKDPLNGIKLWWSKVPPKGRIAIIALIILFFLSAIFNK